MGTSEFGYRVLIDTSDVGNSTNAVDVIWARSIMNNANHLADEFAQVRATMSGTVPALSGKAGYLTSRTPIATETKLMPE